MTAYRLQVRHPSHSMLLMIERLTLAEALTDYALLAAEGWSLVGHPVAVEIPELQEAAAV